MKKLLILASVALVGCQPQYYAVRHNDTGVKAIWKAERYDGREIQYKTGDTVQVRYWDPVYQVPALKVATIVEPLNKKP